MRILGSFSIYIYMYIYICIYVYIYIYIYIYIYGACCWKSLNEYFLNIYESFSLVFEDDGTSLVF